MWAQDIFFFLRNRLILNFHPPGRIILSRHTRGTQRRGGFELRTRGCGSAWTDVRKGEIRLQRQ